MRGGGLRSPGGEGRNPVFALSSSAAPCFRCELCFIEEGSRFSLFSICYVLRREERESGVDGRSVDYSTLVAVLLRAEFW